MNRAVFLDRDGVINLPIYRDGRAFAPTRVADFQFMPGIQGLVEMVRNAGFRIVVVTNQPDVVNGKMSLATLQEMHQLLQRELRVDEVRACLHVDGDECECRKPKAGMLRAAAAQFNLDLPHSFIIGDTWRDMSAGKTAGCTTILLDSGYADKHGDSADHIVQSFDQAVEIILNA